METPGEFELSILTQTVDPAPALAPAPTPPSQSMTVIGSLEEMRAAFNRVAASAQRLMSIYTPDLEPELYDQTEFLDIVKRFVLGRNFAKVRVVLGDGARLLRDGNRFVAMGRRLTSYIDIRYQPVTGMVLDADSITDPGAEFAITGEGRGTVSFASIALPVLRLTNSNTFRYFLQGDFGGHERLA